MQSDILERLRHADGGYFMRKMFTEAADEIERLRAELADTQRHLDEARVSLSSVARQRDILSQSIKMMADRIAELGEKRREDAAGGDRGVTIKP